jgi:hypothetical protein
MTMPPPPSAGQIRLRLLAAVIAFALGAVALVIAILLVKATLG